MTARIVIKDLYRRCDGAAGAEFALVLPLLLLFLFGMIDVGRYMFEVNELEKATQAGARMAVVTDMVPTDLGSKNFGLTLGQGAPIPTSSFGGLHCDKFGGTLQCSCDSNCGGIGMTANSVAFAAVVNRMKAVAPILADTNVRITYTNSGLGYAGDPNGSDVAPIVTVSTGNNLSLYPFALFGASISLPVQSASLTLEDAAGSTSN